MPKVPTAMKGIFADMLGDYLRVVAKEGGQAAGKEAGQAAGREIGQAAVKAADEVVVPFKVTKKMQKHKDELIRQLNRQLDNMPTTPKKLLEALENPAKRTGKAQREAREQFAETIRKRQDALMRDLRRTDPDALSKQLADFGISPSGNGLKDAKALAEARSDGFMRTIAALHEPDIVAGGLDHIGRHGNGVHSFGLSNVNSSIGSQWKNLKPDLIEMLKTLDPDKPIRLTHPL